MKLAAQQPAGPPRQWLIASTGLGIETAVEAFFHGYSAAGVEEDLMGEWQDQRRRFLEGTSLHHVEFDVLEETYGKALDLIRENQWEEDEGFAIIFVNGLEYLRAERAILQLNQEGLEAKMADELQRTFAQLLDESSKYAAMKFRAYQLSQDNQILEMREAGLRGELAMAEQCMKILRQEAEQMEARIRELETENHRLKALVPEQARMHSQEATKKSLTTHLKWWGRRQDKPVPH